jgi:hypothetical protein
MDLSHDDLVVRLTFVCLLVLQKEIEHQLGRNFK